MSLNAEWEVAPVDELRTVPIDCCPLCEGTVAAGALHMKDHLHGVPGRFTYTQCAGCGSVYQNPRVADDDLSACYPSAYFTHSRPVYHLQRQASGWRTKLRGVIRHYSDGNPLPAVAWPIRVIGHVLSWVPTFCRRARFGLPNELQTAGDQRCLEVGPGQGIELAQLAAIGWDAVGLEFDTVAAETARQVSGREVKVGTLTDCALAPGSFHLIYMSHVLEHLPNLGAALRSAYQLLAPGGRLVAIYPNPDSFATRWYGGYSCNWDAPRHLVLPSCRGIFGLFTKLGYERVTVRTSARRASAFRSMALAYRSGDRITGFTGKPSLLNKPFHWLEAIAVACGLQVGEEVFVTAYKPTSTT